MNKSLHNLSFGKHYILTSIINNTRYDTFFNKMDCLLVKKRFSIAAELSLTENILHISTYKLTSNNILKIINDFIKSVSKPNFQEKRNLFEVVKISNLPQEKLDKTISTTLHLELIKALNYVSRETNLMNFNFLILRIADNFILKNNNNTIEESYLKLRDKVIRKIIYGNQDLNKEEKETILLCWVDRILSALINKEISPNEFIIIANKIFNINIQSIPVRWKVYNAVNYTLLQPEFSTSSVLKTFKRELLSSIKKQYNNVNLTLDELKDLLITTLAKRTPYKENFYYLFDVIKLTANRDEEARFFCLTLCKYIVNYNKRQNIFCYRFVRKYFIDMLFNIIKKPNENIKIKEEEVEILIALFHIDSYFSFYRPIIFGKIVEILQTINTGKIKLNNKNFYRYCDVLDYMMSENKDIIHVNIVKILSINNDDENKIKKYFTLAFSA